MYNTFTAYKWRGFAAFLICLKCFRTIPEAKPGCGGVQYRCIKHSYFTSANCCWDGVWQRRCQTEREGTNVNLGDVLGQYDQKRNHTSWKSKNLQEDKNMNSVKQTSRYTGRSSETQTNKCACLDTNSESLFGTRRAKRGKYVQSNSNWKVLWRHCQWTWRWSFNKGFGKCKDILFLRYYNCKEKSILNQYIQEE